jgi:hypothetical protein
MDWSAVFDDMYPLPGASEAEIAQFVASIGAPLSKAEVAVINRSQRNPFPKGDPLHAAYRPFDPSQWVIPNRPLPSAYLAFLRWSNGGEFRTGERWLQVFPALDPRHGARAMMLAYQLPEYMPGALPFAFNGGGTFYLFDMRLPAAAGEYPVVCSHSGSLGWEPAECVQVAESFEGVCRGSVNVDELR